MQKINSINSDLEAVLKNTDWFYEYAEGRAWSEGRNSYQNALVILKDLSPETRKKIIDMYVPEKLRESILRDIESGV